MGCPGKGLAPLEGEGGFAPISYQLGGGWPAASQGLGVSGADSPCRVGMFALSLLFPMALSCLCSEAGGGGRGEGAAGGKGACVHTTNPAVSCYPKCGRTGSFYMAWASHAVPAC